MNTVVRTRQGAVRGSLVDGVFAFKGIPYAAAPFGSRRFLPPQPAPAWDGVRDALTYGPTVPKPPYFPPFDVLLPEPVIAGEECLNLNIWTPDTGHSGLPVMVWIHGGAFRNGTGVIPTYDGSRFARDGVVCVTINYRLGIDGFLYFGDGNANRGLLDQVAALEWVRENIAAFGGDSSNVTIFGESAGGMSVTSLLSMPRAEGLFRRAIAQSGAGHHAHTPETSRLVTHHLAELLQVEATPDALAAIPLERLVAAQVELANDVIKRPDPALWGEVLVNLMPFEPTIDGDALPQLPIKHIFAGASKGVEVLVGTNSEEYRFFTVPPGLVDAVTDQYLSTIIAAYGLPLEETLAIYRALLPEGSRGDILTAIMTDQVFRIPAMRLAEAVAERGDTAYMYEFTWRSRQFDDRLGASHTLEIPFVFDNLHMPEYYNLLGDNPPQELADEMHASWVAFAKYGDPGWPRYDLKRRATMNFNTLSEVVDDPHQAERALWEGRR